MPNMNTTQPITPEDNEEETMTTNFDGRTQIHLSRAEELIQWLNQNPQYGTSLHTTDPELKAQAAYTHDRPAIKRKGGHPPVEFSAIELKVTLEESLLQGDTQTALLTYFQLKRLLNW